MKTALATAAAALLFASAAYAQSSNMVEVNDDVMVDLVSMNADDAEDLDVMVDGAKVGEVEEVLGTDEQTPMGFAVDFDDDATYGDGDRIIAFDQFTYANDMLTLNADPASVMEMDRYDD